MTTIQLTQKIQRLDQNTLEEVGLFVDFLLHKQQNTTPEFERGNVANVLEYAGRISDDEAAEMKQSVQEAFGNIEGDW